MCLSLQRERKTLSVKRLDLDAAKSRTRKLQGDKLMQANTTLTIIDNTLFPLQKYGS